MSIDQIGFLIYINMVPMFLLGFGCYVLYLFVSYETRRKNRED